MTTLAEVRDAIIIALPDSNDRIRLCVDLTENMLGTYRYVGNVPGLMESIAESWYDDDDQINRFVSNFTRFADVSVHIETESHIYRPSRRGWYGWSEPDWAGAISVRFGFTDAPIVVSEYWQDDSWESVIPLVLDPLIVI